jgi:hypothetical protein
MALLDASLVIAASEESWDVEARAETAAAATVAQATALAAAVAAVATTGAVGEEEALAARAVLQAAVVVAARPTWSRPPRLFVFGKAGKVAPQTDSSSSAGPKALDFAHYTVTAAAAAPLVSCGASQPPIGVPMLQRHGVYSRR